MPAVTPCPWVHSCAVLLSHSMPSTPSQLGLLVCLPRLFHRLLLMLQPGRPVSALGDARDWTMGGSFVKVAYAGGGDIQCWYKDIPPRLKHPFPERNMACCTACYSYPWPANISRNSGGLRESCRHRNDLICGTSTFAFRRHPPTPTRPTFQRACLPRLQRYRARAVYSGSCPLPRIRAKLDGPGLDNLTGLYPFLHGIRLPLF